jgi:hypothetical protein
MSVIQLKKCTLPETNIKHYLTAITALNIYSEDGTGDWYFSENFLEDGDFIPRKTVAGVATEPERGVNVDHATLNRWVILHPCAKIYLCFVSESELLPQWRAHNG